VHTHALFMHRAVAPPSLLLSASVSPIHQPACPPARPPARPPTMHGAALYTLTPPHPAPARSCHAMPCHAMSVWRPFSLPRAQFFSSVYPVPDLHLRVARLRHPAQRLPLLPGQRSSRYSHWSHLCRRGSGGRGSGRGSCSGGSGSSGHATASTTRCC
jgi:hypothetical protein